MNLRSPKQRRDEDALFEETLHAGVMNNALTNHLFNDQLQKAGLRFASELMTAMGHPTRLRIVSALRNEPMTVNHIANDLDVHQANISQHLAVLLRAGVVTREPVGTARRYHLRDESLGKICDIVEQFWQSHREDIAAEKLG